MKRYLMFLFCLIIAAALISCGSGGGSSSAPADSAITVTLPNPAITNPSQSEIWVNQTLYISVKNSAGQALGDRTLDITFSLSTLPAASSDLPVVEFSGSKKTTCETNNMGECNVPVSFKTKPGLNYDGNLEVSSGSNPTLVPFAVTGG